MTRLSCCAVWAWLVTVSWAAVFAADRGFGTSQHEAFRLSRDAGYGGTVNVYGSQSGHGYGDDRQFATEYDEAGLTSLAFSPDAKFLIACYYLPGRDRAGSHWRTWVTQFELATGKATVIKQATAPVAFSASGELLMGYWQRKSSHEGAPTVQAAIWKLGEDKPQRILDTPPPNGDSKDSESLAHDSVVAATLSPRGDRAVTMSASGQVRLWYLDKDDPPFLLGRMSPHGGPAVGEPYPVVAYSTWGGEIITAVSDANGQGDLPAAMVWSGQGSKFKVSSRTKHLAGALLFDRLPPTLPLDVFRHARARGQRHPVFTPNSLQRSTVATAGRDDGQTIYALAGPGKTTIALPPAFGAQWFTHLPFGSRAVAMGPKGNLLATRDGRSGIRVWDIREGRLRQTLTADKRPATFRVAAIQMASRFGRVEENRKQISNLVASAVYGGAKIVVLPETAITGYMSQDLVQTWQVGDRAVTKGLTGIDPADVAETVPGDSTRFIAALAEQHGIYLTAPLLEVDRKSGRYYNTVVLFDPHGRQRIHYRKRNPWQWAERGWASEGDLGNPVIDTPYGRLGVLVCFDIHRQSRILRDLKVDTLLYSIAWVDESTDAWFAERLPRIAAENNFHIVGANWTVSLDKPPGWDGYGHSLIINRKGKHLASVKDHLHEAIVFADVPMP